MKIPGLLTVPALSAEVERIIEEDAPRFVAIVFNTQGQHIGSGPMSYQAICSALGSVDRANDLCADMEENPSPYLYDEEFKRDTWRGYSKRTGENLCILIRC